MRPGMDSGMSGALGLSTLRSEAAVKDLASGEQRLVAFGALAEALRAQ